MRSLAAVAALLITALVVLPGSARADSDKKKLFTFHDSRITESSGLAASRVHPGIVYTFNDSGGRPELYAIGPDGRTKATIRLGGAVNRDWEAMAVGPDGLYVGDIGDNLDSWPHVTVYRIPEPKKLTSRTVRATAYKIRYSDGPRNAEAMMIDPRDGRLYIASKEIGGSLYRAPKKLRTSGYNIMKPVGDAPLYATDAAYAPDGRTFVIRTYWDAEVYKAPDDSVSSVSIPGQKQGEGITYSADGRTFLLSSEGRTEPVWQVPVPEEALPRTSAAASAKATKRAAKEHGKNSPTLLLVVLGGVVLVGAVVFARRRAS